MTSDLTLSEPEIVSLTGYKRPADQVRELHRQGFHRARRAAVTGDVILERVHYDAVCAGLVQARQPQVKAPVIKLRAA